MDAPRRWQVASLATAVTGLGIGGMLVDRPSSAPVAPIVLEAAFEPPDQGERFRLLQEPVPIPGPEIVTADVISGTTPLSGGSTASADDEPAATTAGTTAPAPAPRPSPSPAPEPAPAPADPASSESTDSPDGADSADSVDRDESVDSD